MINQYPTSNALNVDMFMCLQTDSIQVMTGVPELQMDYVTAGCLDDSHETALLEAYRICIRKI